MTMSQKDLIAQLANELRLEPALTEIMMELHDRGDASAAIAELLDMKKVRQQQLEQDRCQLRSSSSSSKMG